MDKNSDGILTESFSQIYARYSGRIYNLAFRMTGDKDLSEDITQETFVKAYSSIAKFRGDSQVFTWIYAIAKNACLRQIKRQGRKSFLALEQWIETASSIDAGEELSQVERRQYVDQVKEGCLLAVLRCLSFNQRMAFILHVLYDLPVADVAGVLGRSVNSTRILIHRARKGVRSFLCKNCSLYDPLNRCRCENLVSFSLKQGWIERYASPVPVALIEEELGAFKNEILLYKSMSSKQPGDELRERILKRIRNGELKIFSSQKVK